MFDKVIVNTSPSRVVHEEHRAPTDDSIRLAKEYEEKIKSEIVDSAVLQYESGLQVAYAVFRQKVENFGSEVRFAFNINGKTCHQKIELSGAEARSLSRDELTLIIIDKVAKVLSVALVNKLTEM